MKQKKNKHFDPYLNYSLDLNYEFRNFSEFRPPIEYFKIRDNVSAFNKGVFSDDFALVFDGDKVTEYSDYQRGTLQILQLQLLKRGFSFVHAISFSMEGKTYFLPATANVGKTSLLSEARKQKKFKFFGDDFVILGKDGRVYSYLKDASIHHYHLPMFPELKGTKYEKYLKRRKRFPFWYEGKHLFNFACKRAFGLKGPILKGWIAETVLVPIKKLTNNVGDSAVIDKIFLWKDIVEMI